MLCFCRIRRPPRSTRACTLCPSTTFCRASGPVVLSAALAPFALLPFVTKDASGFRLIEEENAGEDHPQTFGRMTAFHGQMGMFTRALAYILSHGADGLKQEIGRAHV